MFLRDSFLMLGEQLKSFWVQFWHPEAPQGRYGRIFEPEVEPGVEKVTNFLQIISKTHPLGGPFWAQFRARGRQGDHSVCDFDRSWVEGCPERVPDIFLPQISMFFYRPELFLTLGMVPQGAHRDVLEVHLFTSSRPFPWHRKWTGILFEGWFFDLGEQCRSFWVQL